MNKEKTRRDVIVIGASAGGVQALQEFIGRLPVPFPAALAITLHRGVTGQSMLPQVLGRHSKTEVIEPIDGSALRQGVVYVAPADFHMVFRSGVVRLERTAKYHHCRPAIDPMFESAAHEFGARVIGVVLTGNLNDGVAGLIEIHNVGGMCLAQDPSEAPYPSMPLSAIRDDHVDHVFRMSELPNLLLNLAGGATGRAAVA